MLMPMLIGAAVLAYANWPRTALPAGIKADRVVVLKAERKLLLLSSNVVLREYAISLGFNPRGQKIREGDGKTPEGSYTIDYRNSWSMAHLALHISYPQAENTNYARQQGVAPGGLIMIHGISNGYGALGRLHRFYDWTDGCIAVTNDEIEEIWRAVPDGTPIDIRA
jgi:murein L,D-transpeptidase YafK